MTYQTRSLVLTAKGCTAAKDDEGHILGCITCGARAVTELPEGFYKVSVVLNERELRELRRTAALMPRGTWGEAIRHELGWPYSPYGLFAAIARMTQPDNNNEE